MQVYKVKRNQNIFDVAVSTHGSIEGIFDLLINNPDLSFHSQLKEGEEIYWDEEFIIYDSIVNTLLAEHIVPANGERHVYYKNTTAPLRCVMYISPEEASIALQMAGDGSLIVDWGDNSDLETITLSPTLQKYVHFFDNYTDERSIKLYGDFNLKTWDLSSINGLMMPTMPLVVDEIISEKNNLSLQGLFLCKGTYLVKLANMSLSSLAPIQDMNLSNLELRNINYTKDTVINDYLIYIAKHNNQRRDCKVILDIQPSGTYKEPLKDSNGNYVITTGMEAIYVITHETAWNEAGSWSFDINGTIYQYENSDIA